MKKNIFQILFMIFFMSTVQGQDLDQAVIVPNGGIHETSDLVLEWTLGETNIDFAQTDSLTVKEGFLQPKLIVSKVETTNAVSNNTTSKLASYDIEVFPNPVESILNIKLQSDMEGTVEVSLFNMNGAQIKGALQKQMTDQFEMDMTNLPTGLYFLRFVEPNSATVETFKIKKL